MDYLKIAEIANRCEVKRQQINEHYRMVGANGQFTEDVRSVFYETIENLKKDLEKLEDKLARLVNSTVRNPG
jgi:hypothetical protein